MAGENPQYAPTTVNVQDTTGQVPTIDQPLPSNIPSIYNPGGGQQQQPSNVMDIARLYENLIKSQAVQRRQVMFPQQLPPQVHTPGDVSGNFVNPNTIGGPKHNARVTMAQSIGKAITDVENRAEQKKARDVAFDVARLEAALNNPTPENTELANQILSDPKRAKNMQEALNLPSNLFGNSQQSDKAKPFIKQARQLIWHPQRNAGSSQAQQQQATSQQAPQQQQRSDLDAITQAAQQGQGQVPQQGQVPGQVPVPGAVQPMPVPQQGGGTSMGAAPPQMTGGAPQQPQAITPAARLMRGMPTTYQLSPEAQINAEAVKLGISPTADKQLDFLKSLASDENKWRMVEAIVGQKDADSIRRQISSEDRTEALRGIARLNVIQRDRASQRTAGSANYRTDAYRQIADSKNILAENIATNKTTLDSVEKEISDDKDIIKSKDAKPDAKKSAQLRMDRMQSIAEGLRTQNKALQERYDQYGSMQSAVSPSGDTTAPAPRQSPDDQMLDNIIQQLVGINENY